MPGASKIPVINELDYNGREHLRVTTIVYSGRIGWRFH